MAAVSISKQDVGPNGLNLTDATYETLVTGAGNGVTFDYHPHNIVVIKNASGLSATVTLKVNQPTAYSGPGLTIPDETVTVADGKTFLYPSLPIFKNSSTAKMTVEADQAVDVIVIRHALS